MQLRYIGYHVSSLNYKSTNVLTGIDDTNIVYITAQYIISLYCHDFPSSFSCSSLFLCPPCVVDGGDSVRRSYRHNGSTTIHTHQPTPATRNMRAVNTFTICLCMMASIAVAAGEEQARQCQRNADHTALEERRDTTF